MNVEFIQYVLQKHNVSVYQCTIFFTHGLNGIDTDYQTQLKEATANDLRCEPNETLDWCIMLGKFRILILYLTEKQANDILLSLQDAPTELLFI